MRYESGQIWEVADPYHSDLRPYLVCLLELDHRPSKEIELWRVKVVVGEVAKETFPVSAEWANTSRFGLGPLNEMEVIAWAAR